MKISIKNRQIHNKSRILFLMKQRFVWISKTYNFNSSQLMQINQFSEKKNLTKRKTIDFFIFFSHDFFQLIDDLFQLFSLWRQLYWIFQSFSRFKNLNQFANNEYHDVDDWKTLKKTIKTIKCCENFAFSNFDMKWEKTIKWIRWRRKL